MKNIFKNKKTIIIVPHQDDELNIAGGILCDNHINKKNIYIVYATNGDYSCSAKTRIRETKKLAKYLDIPLDNLIFLGYSDQYSDNDKHFYMNNSSNPTKYDNNRTTTYCVEGFDDYHYKKTKTHANFNRESFISDITQVISDIKPEIIITIDFDSHPDHRALSLSFEEALGKIVKDDSEYRPMVFKTFAYPLAYFSAPDFNKCKSNNAKFITEKYSISKYQNPYYDIKDAYIIESPNNCKRKLLLFNKLYKCLRKYKSQRIVKKCFSIINDNYIYWYRKTDNLLYNAKIETSSGNSKYLCDFKYFDCMDIMKGKEREPKLSPCSCVLDKKDLKKEIKIKFSKQEEIKEIKIYSDINSNSRITLIIEINSDKYDLVLNNKYVNSLLFDKKLKTNEISIRIKESINYDFGLSEIEVFKNDNELSLSKYKSQDEVLYNNIVVKLINILTVYFDWYVARIINKYKKICKKF